MWKQGKKIIPRSMGLFLGIIVFMIMGYIGMSPAENIEKERSELTEIEKKENGAPEDFETEKAIQIHFLDVGQGKSILIQKGHEGILIDGGEKEYGDFLVAYLRQAEIDALKIIATHPHSDHIGGLIAVVNQMKISEIIMPDAVNTTNTYEALMLGILDKEIPVTLPKIGDTISFHGGTFSCFFPDQPDENLNNMSLVYKFEMEAISFLFTGDIEKKAEDALLSLHEKGYIDLSATVLDVPHHGSDTSSSLPFLEAVDPKIAVFSVGKDNLYDHPRESILKRYEDLSVDIRRTDELGSIVFTTDGKYIES